MSSYSIFGGDEVGALVLEAGTRTFRCGFGGEELPKLDIPSFYAHILEESADASAKKYIFDDVNLSSPRSTHVLNPMFDKGTITDWDAFENMCSYILENRMHIVPNEHPLLIVEPYNTSDSTREKMSEILFEKLDIAALNFSKSPPLVAFSHGKTSALVIDVGHSGTSVCPVSDGFCLGSFCKSTLVGGAALNSKLKEYLLKNYSSDIIPRQILNKNVDDYHSSWRDYFEMLLLEDIQKHSMYILGSSGMACNDSGLEYYFPNGNRRTFTPDYLNISELYFNQKVLATSQYHNQLPIQNLVHSASMTSDVDVRANLVNSIIICGGGSNISGFFERLQNELVKFMSPNIKAKLLCGNQTERKFAAWTGGSILSSVGSFQQMWTSKQEHSESGPKIVNTKVVT